MNPFSLSFGKEPVNIISREKQKNEILEAFTSEKPEFQVCMLTGVRGFGKTVMMTGISSEIKKDKDWIVTELNPEEAVYEQKDKNDNNTCCRLCRRTGGCPDCI